MAKKKIAQKVYERINELPKVKQSNILLGIIGKDGKDYTIIFSDDSVLEFDRKKIKLKIRSKT